MNALPSDRALSSRAKNEGGCVSTSGASVKERKRHLYRTNPEFRQRAIDRAKKTAQANASDPEWVRLVQLRKDIYRLRESIAARLAHAARLERRLMRRIRERDEIQARRKAAKA